MDQEYLDRAKRSLERVGRELETMSQPKTEDELEDAWSDFLINLRRLYLRLKKATLNCNCKGWYGKEFGKLTEDAGLLPYMFHSRHHDEYGEEVASTTGAVITFVPRSTGSADYRQVAVEADRGVYAAISEGAGELPFDLGTITLKTFVDEMNGKTYHPPKNACGEQMTGLEAAKETYEHLKKVISEAEDSLRKCTNAKGKP